MATKLSKKQYYKLFTYLQNHENDIANGINDYGDLTDIFRSIIGRDPEA